MAISTGLLDLQLSQLLVAVSLVHVYLTPYTKVEESFNIQAIHDWLFLGISRLEEWDHIVFPGAVPRSFIPSLLVAIASYPPLILLKSFNIIQTSADVQLYIRYGLALLNSSATLFFIHRICNRLEIPAFISIPHTGLRQWTKRFLLLISMAQFHLPFWSSRTIPNSLALPGVLVALALILPRGLPEERNHLIGVAILSILSFIYRLELLGVLGGCGLYLLHQRWYTPRLDTDPHPVESTARLAGTAQASASIAVSCSMLLDTFLWKSERWMLPEIEALRFNVVEGKSAEWGVSPWHFYLTNSLPKLLSFTAPLLIIGLSIPLRSIWQTRGNKMTKKDLVLPPTSAIQTDGTVSLVPMLLLPMLHVSLLSLLGHKEWRFILYVVPLLNVVSAVGAALLWLQASRSGRSQSLASSISILASRCAVIGVLGLTLLLTIVSTLASMGNYPGGEALATLHRLAAEGKEQEPFHVHISAHPAMSGVTLLQSIHLSRPIASEQFAPSILPSSASSSWIYNKTEGLSLYDAYRWQDFTHLLTDVPDCRLPFDGQAQATKFSSFETIDSFHESAGLYLKLFKGVQPSLRISRDVVSLIGGVVQVQLFEKGLEPSETMSVQGLRLLLGTGASKRGIAIGIKRQTSVWLCRRQS